jgi:hypothetical protein
MIKTLNVKSYSRRINKVIKKFKNIRKVKDTNFPEEILTSFRRRYSSVFYRIFLPKSLQKAEMKSYFINNGGILFSQSRFPLEFCNVTFPCLLIAENDSIFESKVMPDKCTSKLYDISYIINTFVIV